MTTYKLGETVTFTATVNDADGAVTDPTSITISIRKPDKAMGITKQAMTKSTTGVYKYNYTIAAEENGLEGTYNVRVTATGAEALVSIETSSFDAEASI